MTHTGILAQNIDGGALCFVAYCREGLQRLGGHTYPDVTMDYIGFGHSVPAALAGDLETVRETFTRSISRLAAAGADFFFCADNTAHLVLDLPDTELPIPGLHIAQTVTTAAADAGFGRVGLLGTKPMVNSDLYPTWLGSAGLAAVRPSPPDLELVDRIIWGELVDGVVTTSSRQQLVDVIERLAEADCDAVLLGSTVLPMLIGPQQSPLPVLDSALLVARHGLAVAVGDQPMPSWRGGPHPQLTRGGS